MDPLSLTASVIAITTAALQSVKAVNDLVGGISDAPHAVTRSRDILSQTQTTLGAFKQTLEAESASYGTGVESVLRGIQLDKALESVDSVCQEIKAAMLKFTSHSKDSRFSTRDRFTVHFNESKMERLNRDLSDSQRTITMVLSSITL